jgi:hypothetical protein
MPLYEDKVRDILGNAPAYRARFLAADTFRGPSLYFHERALATRREPASVTHLEYVYATLVSWGMHRMGRGGSKMKPFAAFRASVEVLEPDIRAAQHFTPQSMDEERWNHLGAIFVRLDAMESLTSIVGNSKVLHHMLPDIIPPIDREYTLRYLRGNTMIVNDPIAEWRVMRGIVEGFFVPLVLNEQFAAQAAQWIGERTCPWETSPMKVIDNLVIGGRKAQLAGQRVGLPGARNGPG